jgi:hypothetical protein
MVTEGFTPTENVPGVPIGIAAIAELAGIVMLKGFGMPASEGDRGGLGM